MKKILLLGGSAQQVIAIETAKKLGYYTVLCDYLPDNPGQYIADRFYPESTTDKEAILEIAKKENVNGVLAYASDPAAPTAAYVAECLGLPTNPYKSVDILCNKDKFREFLHSHGFNTPKSKGCQNMEEAMSELKSFSLPVLVKPVDSSGSKGVAVLCDLNNANDIIQTAFSCSKNNRIIIEEYIEKKHPYLIGGDIFVYNGEVILWGLMNCYRDNQVNSLVPVGKSYPPDLNQSDLELMENVLQQLIEKLDICSGALNVELVLDKQNRVWPIDIGPRSGGNMIPDLMGYIFSTDVVEMIVKTAMGEKIDVREYYGNFYYATHNLHAINDGVFKEVWFSDDIETYIIKKCIYKKPGDKVEYFDNASKALGIIFLKFDNQECMDNILNNINEYIKILVD